MTNNESILDKIIESQEKQKAADFNPSDLISELFKEISTKESDILARRFGLLGKNKETLEQIGNYYNITRERIRQIETATIKKIRDLRTFQEQIEAAERHITHLLENYGGFMEEDIIKVDELDSLIKLLNGNNKGVYIDWEEMADSWLMLIRPIWFEELQNRHGKRLILLSDIRKRLLTGTKIP